MKKATLISTLILVLGFVLECFYLMTDSIFLKTKAYLLGGLCILIGCLGLWVYTLLPFINSRLVDRNERN